jgi:hypothetical protein
MGMIKVVFGATHDHDPLGIRESVDPTNRATIIPFPASLATTVVG